jgi:hypothetical protein
MLPLYTFSLLSYNNSIEEDEFVRLVDLMMRGNPHEGPVISEAGEYCSTSVWQALLKTESCSIAPLASSAKDDSTTDTRTATSSAADGECHGSSSSQLTLALLFSLLVWLCIHLCSALLPSTASNYW